MFLNIIDLVQFKILNIVEYICSFMFLNLIYFKLRFIWFWLDSFVHKKTRCGILYKGYRLQACNNSRSLSFQALRILEYVTSSPHPTRQPLDWYGWGPITVSCIVPACPAGWAGINYFVPAWTRPHALAWRAQVRKVSSGQSVSVSLNTE